MKKGFIISLVLLLFNSIADTYAQEMYEYLPVGGAHFIVQVNGTDTVFLANIHEIYVFPKQQFKNKAQEQFYWRTVRDVKKMLPFAKLVASEMIQTNMKLAKLPNDKQRKAYLNQFEKEVLKKYEPELKKMTISQGKLLLKLIDRECEQSSYELIKIYRGNLTAFFWQGVARIFGTNLKDNYDASDKDQIIERVILLVEAGQL